MKEVTLEGLQDLLEDFSTAFNTERVNLSEALICQVKSIRNKDETEDIACLLVTSVATMKQNNKTLTVSKKIVPTLMQIGCFFQIGKKRYLPNEDVKGHCMYDYFDIAADKVLNSFSEKEDSLLLATKFRNVGKIGFVSTRLNHGFYRLVGMKAMSGCNQDTAVYNISKLIHEKYSVNFYTDYMDQKHLGMNFRIFCRIDGKTTQNGIPLYVVINDNATARKSMQISIAAKLHDRMFKIQTMYVNHRLRLKDIQLTEAVLNMLQECENLVLHTEVSSKTIIDTLLPYVPKKGREKFSESITNSCTPIIAAYDVMNAGIFNLLAKQHKTQHYDGGKEKYETALGKLLTE